MDTAYIVGPCLLAPGAELGAGPGASGTELGAMYPRRKPWKRTHTRHEHIRRKRNCAKLNSQLHTPLCPVRVGFFADNAPGAKIILRGQIAGDVTPGRNQYHEKDFQRLFVDVKVDAILRELTPQECSVETGKVIPIYGTRFVITQAFRNGVRTVSCYLRNHSITNDNLLTLPAPFPEDHVETTMTQNSINASNGLPATVASNAYIVRPGPLAPGTEFDTDLGAGLGFAGIPAQLMYAMNPADAKCRRMSLMLSAVPVEILIENSKDMCIMVRGIVTGEVLPDIHAATNKKDYTRLHVGVRVLKILHEMDQSVDGFSDSFKAVSSCRDLRTNRCFSIVEHPNWIREMSCYLINPDVSPDDLLRLPESFPSVNASTRSVNMTLEQNGVLKGCTFVGPRRDRRW